MKIVLGSKSYLKALYQAGDRPTMSFVLVGGEGQTATKDAKSLLKSRGVNLAQLVSHSEFKADGKAPLFFPMFDDHLMGVTLLPLDYSSPKDVDAGYHRARMIRVAAESILAEAHARHASTIEIVGSWLSEEDLAEFLAHLQAGPNLDDLKLKAPERIALVYVLTKVTTAVIGKAKAVGEALSFAKRMVLLPPNLKRPVTIARDIKTLFSQYKNVTVDVLDRRALRKLGAGGVLAVGGAGEPVMLRITYSGAKAKSKMAIVGKGVTMDTGGYCIKPGATQEEMKGDCGGAAATVGAMLALAGMQAKVSVTAYVPLVENLIDSTAMLTADAITMMDGHTVEIGNTDAEGRLILADALTLAQREGATEVVDLATLTGACVTALGKHYAGLFANNPDLAKRIIAAGEASGEHYWQLPLAPEHEGEVKGYVADYRNIGKGPGAIVAALFLNAFIQEDVSWAHLDIAGPAIDGFEKGNAPAFGVLTLIKLVLDSATDK